MLHYSCTELPRTQQEVFKKSVYQNSATHDKFSKNAII